MPGLYEALLVDNGKELFGFRIAGPIDKLHLFKQMIGIGLDYATVSIDILLCADTTRVRACWTKNTLWVKIKDNHHNWILH